MELEELGVAYDSGEKPPSAFLFRTRCCGFSGKTDNFIKGRQCENEGLGVGAFAYYRRVVENHKNEIFDEIIKVCETVGASKELIKEVGSANKEFSFTEVDGADQDRASRRCSHRSESAPRVAQCSEHRLA